MKYYAELIENVGIIRFFHEDFFENRLRFRIPTFLKEPCAFLVKFLNWIAHIGESILLKSAFCQVVRLMAWFTAWFIVDTLDKGGLIHFIAKSEAVLLS